MSEVDTIRIPVLGFVSLFALFYFEDARAYRSTSLGQSGGVATGFMSCHIECKIVNGR